MPIVILWFDVKQELHFLQPSFDVFHHPVLEVLVKKILGLRVVVGGFVEDLLFHVLDHEDQGAFEDFSVEAVELNFLVQLFLS